MMSVPAIYAPRFSSIAQVGWGPRLLAAATSLGCAAVLGFAALIEPSPKGLGTQTPLNLPPCLWIQMWDFPCPSCGMTTSYAYFVRGQLLGSLYVQPMGTVLVILTAAAFWVGLYITITGKPALRLMRIVPMRYYLIPLMAAAIAAWGWKIYIHTHGIDGWR